MRYSFEWSLIYSKSLYFEAKEFEIEDYVQEIRGRLERSEEYKRIEKEIERIVGGKMIWSGVVESQEDLEKLPEGLRDEIFFSGCDDHFLCWTTFVKVYEKHAVVEYYSIKFNELAYTVEVWVEIQ